MKVLAAVVTHNRCELLTRCITAIREQLHSPDHLVVIDNASTDGTTNKLDRLGVHCITQENLGSAGGWRRAIRYALSNGFDAVWLMDDDGYPDKEALLNLVSNVTSDVSCLSSVVLKIDSPSEFVFPFPVLNSKGLPVLFSLRRKIARLSELEAASADGTYDFAHFFNGTLVRTEAIRQVGNVNVGFFMFGDEVDYFFRLREVGAVKSLLAARHYHPDVSGRPYTPQKVYYYVKNSIILNHRYFDWAPIRDLMCVMAVLYRTARRNGVADALGFIFGRYNGALYKAIARGARGNIAKDF